MSSENAPRIGEESLDRFCDVTGATEDSGRHYLEASGGDIRSAIDMFFESTGSGEPIPDDDGVRAPIPQVRERLVGGEVNYVASTSWSGGRRTASQAFNSLRNFHEDFLEQGPSHGGASSKLARLFRPPVDLLFRGSFNAAKEFGTAKNRWLVVDVQKSDEFPCQTLNRDLWRDAGVKRLVKDSFVLWQVDSRSSDGERFVRFYEVKSWPHVSVLDPRTGERVTQCGAKDLRDAESFCRFAEKFLEQGPPDNDDSLLGNHGGSGSNNNNSEVEQGEQPISILDADEDEQLKAAIKASLEVEEAIRKSVARGRAIILSDSDDDDDDDDDGEVEKEEKEVDCPVEEEEEEEEGPREMTPPKSAPAAERRRATVEDFMGPPTDAKTKLVLRLPSGERRVLEWPCTTKLRSLLLYVEENGARPGEEFQLLIGFPRRAIDTSTADDTTLVDAKLHPQETLLVHIP